MPALVPEFAVRNWRRSLAFYRDVLGFRVCYLRPEEGFAYLALGDAELMLDQIGLGRDFDRLDPGVPLGRGLNVQISVPHVAPLVRRIIEAGHPLHLPLEVRWYRRGIEDVGQSQFVVADPDGYLLRFCEHLGTRPASGEDDARA